MRKFLFTPKKALITILLCSGFHAHASFFTPTCEIVMSKGFLYASEDSWNLYIRKKPVFSSKNLQEIVERAKEFAKEAKCSIRPKKCRIERDFESWVLKLGSSKLYSSHVAGEEEDLELKIITERVSILQKAGFISGECKQTNRP